MIYLFLADGFEDIEAIATIDILRRCGFEVQTLSVTGKRVVTGAHGTITKADSLFRKNHLVHCEALVFPGGAKGAETLSTNQVLRAAIRSHDKMGTLLCAICAAPRVLGAAGVLQGRHATIYPGMEEYIDGAICHRNVYVVEHANIITACGPAATFDFALAIARRLVKDAAIVDKVAQGMCFPTDQMQYERMLNFTSSDGK